MRKGFYKMQNPIVEKTFRGVQLKLFGSFDMSE